MQEEHLYTLNVSNGDRLWSLVRNFDKLRRNVRNDGTLWLCVYDHLKLDYQEPTQPTTSNELSRNQFTDHYDDGSCELRKPAGHQDFWPRILLFNYRTLLQWRKIKNQCPRRCKTTEICPRRGKIIFQPESRMFVCRHNKLENLKNVDVCDNGKAWNSQLTFLPHTSPNEPHLPWLLWFPRALFHNNGKLQ